MRFVCVLVALLVAVPSARADDDEKPTHRAVIDRVELEPAAAGGERLRVFLSALTLQGQLLDLTDPKAIKLLAGSTEVRAPYALGRYADAQSHTAIVLVVQATVEYADVLPVIAETFEQNVVPVLDDRTQLAILPYGESVGTAKLAPAKQSIGKLRELAGDDAGDPALLDTLERALLLLRKAKTEPEGRELRKMIVVIGDGRDMSGDRDRVTRLGTRAAREGVRIHSFAFSPNDVRRPLLLLGELSKRSLGTFRWLRTPNSESWTPAFQQLRDEIAQQYVLTYFVDSDEVALAGRKIKVVTSGRAEATSNEHKVPEPSCAGTPCERGYCAGSRCVVPRQAEGRGVFGWILLVGGIAIGVLFVLGLIGYVMTKRQQRAAAAPPPQAFPSGAPAAFHSARPAAAPAVTAGPRLFIINGPRAGQQVSLRHGFLIGKQPGCDLIFDDGYTSSQHAQIAMDAAGNCRLYDRGSTNGTFVNGVRVTDCALDHGVVLRIGSTELQYLAQ